MRIQFDSTWCARRAGGLNLGVSFHFPVATIDDYSGKNPRWLYSLHIALVVVILHINVTTRRVRGPENFPL